MKKSIFLSLFLFTFFFNSNLFSQCDKITVMTFGDITQTDDCGDPGVDLATFSVPINITITGGMPSVSLRYQLGGILTTFGCFDASTTVTVTADCNTGFTLLGWTSNINNCETGTVCSDISPIVWDNCSLISMNIDDIIVTPASGGCSGGTASFDAQLDISIIGGFGSVELSYELSGATQKISWPAGTTLTNHTQTFTADCASDFYVTAYPNTVGIGSACDPPAPIFFPMILPVELISFDARLIENDKVLLSWATASEENNDYFEVIHSLNAVDFRQLEQIQGYGTTDRARFYNFIHEAPSLGSNYYRIKQVDFDGRFEYFEIAEVTIESKADFIVYPSQVFDVVSLVTPEAVRKDTEVSIYNSSGLKLRTSVLKEGQFKISFDVNNLSSGVYFIRFVNNNFDYSAKQFFKMRD